MSTPYLWSGPCISVERTLKFMRLEMLSAWAHVGNDRRP